MYCDTPHIVDVKKPLSDGSLSAPVPCGRCPQCKKNRISHWLFRLLQEDRVSNNSSFVTLTYNTDNVPISPFGFMNLCKRDFQLFMKRLRKLHPKDSSIKYYAVGEYGSKSWRPHYHAIMFNVDVTLIEKAWTSGGVHIGNVSAASVAYTAKYINKPKRVPHFKGDDRIPEFSLMSKGLGKSYLSDSVVRYHKADLSRNFVTIEDGIKIPLPRYYRDKIYTEDELVKQRSLIVRRINEIDHVSRSDYYKDNPDGDYDLFCEQERIARYNSFYHFSQNIRDL